MKKTLIISLFALVFIYSFTPQDVPNSFTDSRDGKVYNTVTIGDQVWMAENLAYLPVVVGSAIGSEEPGYESVQYFYVYGYNGTVVADAKATDNYQTYGVLYNWPAAMTACPDGWHLPSDAEWKQLEIHLGMSQEDTNKDGYRATDEGGKLKEVGTTHWKNPNEGATNESGFTALPGGYRFDTGKFNFSGFYGNWWSSTQGREDRAWNRGLDYDYSNLIRSDDPKEEGYSVRCVRD